MPEVSDASRSVISKASVDFIELAKKSGEKKQINYAKCNKLFEEFLRINYMNKEVANEFASKMKKEKNILNIAYLLQTVSGKRDWAAVKNEKLMSLAMFYHVWPELLLECVQKSENAKN